MIRFTKEEKLILLFLLAALFVGIGVSYYKKIHPHAGLDTAIFEKYVKSGVKININKATKEELVRLRGIGPVLAERIVSYREKHGPFPKKEDIKNVKGIGEKTFERLKDRLVLE